MSMYKDLQRFGHVKTNEPMSKHTTFKIGGPADYFVTVDSVSNLVDILRYLDGEGAPYFVLGGGSNMLVKDEGYRGVVVHVSAQKFEIDADRLTADAGSVTVEVARQSIQAGLTGFEWGVGVPGTIGGAVRGNAGAMGGEMKDVVESVEAYRDGEVIRLTNAECGFGYRESIFKHSRDVVLRATLVLERSENKEGMKKALEHLQYRSKTQPQGYASTGCIFKNFEISGQKLDFEVPEEFIKRGTIAAGWLVDQAGMKGAQVGKAMVSERHGNFVVNAGGASAADVMALVEQIKEKVYTKFRISLQEEIQIIG